MNSEELEIVEEQILFLEGIEDYRNKKWDHYTYNGVGIPRTTHILKACRDNDGLIQWAASMGYKRHKEIRERALTVGSIVHEKIDHYLKYLLVDPTIKEDLDTDIIAKYLPRAYYKDIDTSYNNFKLWVNKINYMGYPIQELVGVEIFVGCPWFGGSIDAIIKINGAYYIVDFKTSKQISPEYLLQTCAYMWVVNSGYIKGLPHINGVGIIRIDKSKEGNFEDLFLNEFNPVEAEMIRNYQLCFGSYLDTYYRTISTDIITKNYSKKYDFEKVIERESNE